MNLINIIKSIMKVWGIRLKLKEIYEPIDQRINKMEDELNNLFSDAGIPCINELFGYFFKNSGKHLRPALTFLSAGAVKKQDDINDNNLVQLALAFELLHSASLVHDDIIDEDLTRRGQKTLNNVFGNKIAVLAGDTLYSSAYSIMSNLFPREYSQDIANLGFKMCVAEIEQAKGSLNRENYFKVIEGKTALFMSICCKLGASLAGATESQLKSLENFGLNLGMAYQIKDDYMDDDPNGLKHATIDDAWNFASKAKESVSGLDDSVYKQNLCGLVDYIMNV
ncbi:polyprenyl synthetase family protein [Tepidibacter aestuarii]|uniref:polyprenyl synthetase family protein n=1 Tax=Tepidibacter aestuarii TaxID=2925782 RepID=UPI0020BF53F7|nr:polyprenyl synthetase family protein [Tepidibacter aestuarii]CAH2213381.1 conserved protein of unknown function [Tepidibacter aestuarii]